MEEVQVYIQEGIAMRLKLGLIAILALMMALVGGTVGAQSSDLFCSTLSAGDCEAFTAAANNMSSVNSADYEMTLNLGIESDDPSTAMELVLTADGSFTGLTGGADIGSLLGAQVGASEQTELDFANLDATLNLNLGLPTMLAMQTGGMESVQLNLAAVDGIGYIDFDALGASMGEMAAAFQLPSGWGGLNLIEAGEQIAGMAGAMTGETTAMTDEQQSAVVAALVANSTGTRDGNTFTFTVDLGGLTSDPNFIAALEESGTATDIGGLAGNVVIVYTLNDANQFSEFRLSGELTPPDSVDDINGLNIDLMLSYANINGGQTISAPADAAIVPTDEFMEGIGGLFMGFGGMMGQ
jgi:hypothetical protein